MVASYSAPHFNATIQLHFRVFEKLGVRDRAAAVSEAYKRHLIS
jgi:ATP/maltotriose-dependent transcriptional regulator MalT